MPIIATVPRLCPGGTVVCVASGPSLTAEDVASARGADAVVAVNDTYRIAPWATVLYAADAPWWQWHQGAPTFSGLKYSVSPDASRWGVEILRNTGREGVELDPTGLRTGMNSGYQAIGIAVHLGATRILLLGYDMGGNGHWFGEHPSGLRRASPFALFRQMFGTMVAPLELLGISVINCSRQTALTCFPRQALQDALCQVPA